MAAADAFVPTLLRTCTGTAVVADTTPHLGELLDAACVRGEARHYETTNFIMGLLRPSGVPLASPRDARREMSGRGYSFRVQGRGPGRRGPWVLWLVERLFSDLPGDPGAGPWLGSVTEGVWVAFPAPEAEEVDYTQRGAQCAACNEPPRAGAGPGGGGRYPRLRYAPFPYVVAPTGAVDVAATLQRLRDAVPPPLPEGPACAACRAAPASGVKLRRCGGCRAVKYCSIACQRDAWPAHKAACKAAQAAAAAAAPAGSVSAPSAGSRGDPSVMPPG